MRRKIIASIAAAGALAGIGVGACGGHSNSSGSSSSSGTQTTWFNDTPDGLVVRFTQPAPFAPRTNFIDQSDNEIPPQTNKPSTGQFNAVCVFRISDGITWTVWDVSSDPTISPNANAQCQTFSNIPGAVQVGGNY